MSLTPPHRGNIPELHTRRHHRRRRYRGPGNGVAFFAAFVALAVGLLLSTAGSATARGYRTRPTTSTTTPSTTTAPNSSTDTSATTTSPAAATPASAPAGTGFYVSTTGSDSNSGTASAPFATLRACQTAMEHSSTIKTCYIDAGTYHLTSNAGSACSDGAGSTGLLLGDADAGETWSYNPSDGYGTAVIDGGSSSDSTGIGTGICIQTNNVTIDGLDVQNFRDSLIHDLGGQNVTIENNIVSGEHAEPWTAAIILNTTVQGSRVVHNVVHDVADSGIEGESCNGGYGGCSQGISNVLVAYNTVYNYCMDDSDCGAVYFQDYDNPRSTNVVAEYNYVRDGNLSGDARGGAWALYSDDGTSNLTFKGNVVTGKQWGCSIIHGGSNDSVTSNICDLQTPVSGDNSSDGDRYIDYFQWSSAGAAMTGDTISGNVVVSDIAGGGNGYAVDMSGGGGAYAPSVSSNGYHNYAGNPTGSCHVGGVNDCLSSGGADASPVSVGSTFNTCPDDGADSWSFELTGTAPSGFSEPANDLGISWGHAGYWGPPGYTIPHSGNAPSYGPTC